MLLSAHEHTVGSVVCDQEIQNKIDILLALKQNLSFMREVQDNPAFHLQLLTEHYETQVKDQVWLRKTFEDLKQTKRGILSQDNWLKQQLLNLKLYTCEYSEVRFDQSYRCYEFYLQLTQQNRGQRKKSIEEAFAEALRNTKHLEHYQQAQYGDTVVYSNQENTTHIGIYIGLFLDCHYVLSKFGQHNIMIHPIEGVPEGYGKANCYRSLIRLHLNEKLLMSLVDSAMLPFKEELIQIIRPDISISKQPSYLPLHHHSSTSKQSTIESCDKIIADTSQSSRRYYCSIL